MTDKQYLKLFRLNEDKYLIGVYQDGITVYKQQVRALNIFHALYNTKLKDRAGDESYTIGVVGGGIAGLTFAAAALEANFKVIIFEKKSIYLHMQFGCDTRKIHPNLYEWPDKKYANPYAELPILDWKHGSAANVVEQVISSWDKISKKAKDRNKKGSKILEEIMSCGPIEVSQIDVNGKERYKLSYEGKVTATVFCDLLIYATGYGVEIGVEHTADTPSYWRNDYFSQIELHSKEPRYIISGVGDGGLIDLFRLKIFDFSYEKILDIIENHADFPELLVKLNEVRTQLDPIDEPSAGALHTLFSTMGNEYYKYIYDTLVERSLFRDTKILLNAKSATFDLSLNYRKMSFLHAFLIFILMENRKNINLNYKGGELTPDGKSYLLPGVKIEETDKIIIRHGTKRDDSIPVGYISDHKDINLKKLKERQERAPNYGLVEKRWSNAELSAIFNPVPNRKYEYLNPSTSILCTNFIAGLSSLLSSYFEVDKDFRISLYRPIYVQGSYFFQRITSYFGTKQSPGNESIGQVFKIDRGNVGLSFLTGKPTLITYKNETQFAKLIASMRLTAELEVIKKNRSFFTLPILAKINGGASLTTNLVLYIESPSADFFHPCPQKADITNLIYAAATGFIKAIKHDIQHHDTRMIPIDYQPLTLTSNIPYTITSNICFEDVCYHNTQLLPENSSLVFDDYYSFTVS